MFFGAQVGQQDMPMEDLRALWRRLDAEGMDWFSIWDHFYEAPPVNGMTPSFESLATLATLAADTERMRIACLVFCALYRNPAALAKALTTIDHISKGRLEFGLGAGWTEMEAQAYGYAFPSVGKRMDMLEEAVQIVQGMLSQDRTTFEGQYFSVHNATCQPPPIQDHVPLWIGGHGRKRTLRIAARYADGWNVTYVGPDELTELCGVLDDWCAVEDRNPAAIQRTVNLMFYCTTKPNSDLSALIDQQMQNLSGNMAEGSLRGTPDDAYERIRRYAAAGADGIILTLRRPWDDEALTVFLREVVPALRRELA